MPAGGAGVTAGGAIPAAGEGRLVLMAVVVVMGNRFDQDVWSVKLAGRSQLREVLIKL
jgi:hypothetical protein